MKIKLAFLGTGTCASTARNPSALAISNGRDVTLVDCGGGCYHQLSRLGDPFFSHDKVGSVLLTHFHADHASGLIDLIWGEMWNPLAPRTAPLVLCGPPGLAGYIKDCLLPCIGGHRIRFEIITVEVAHGDNFCGPFFSARSYRLSHSDTSTGFHFDTGNTKFCVTGDTGYCGNLLELLSLSDIAFMEWSLSGSEVTPYHLSDTDMLRLIRENVMPPRVFFTHMYPQPGITIDHLIKARRELLGNRAGKFFFPQDMDIVELT